MPTDPHAAYRTPSDRPTDERMLFEIRPDAATFGRGVGVRALIFLPLIAVGIYRSAGRNGIGWSVLLYGGLVTALVVGALIMLQTSSVVLTTTTVEKHRRWLPAKVVPRASVASGVLVAQYASAFNRTAPLLVLLGGNGKPLLRLTGQVFAESDLFTFAERFGYGFFDVLEGVAGPEVVAARHRALLPLVERRPGLIIVAGTALLLVAVVVGVSLFAPVG